MNGEFVRVLNLPDVRENMRAIGLMGVPSTPEQFAALIKSTPCATTASRARRTSVSIEPDPLARSGAEHDNKGNMRQTGFSTADERGLPHNGLQ